MHRQDRTIARPAARLAWLGAVVAFTGCTMCPDPYDYSGPVPNGSAPQNEFRARSRGILPVGAAARPWPPIVQAGGHGGDGAAPSVARSTGTPTLADPAIEVVSGTADAVDADEAPSVLVTAVTPATADETVPARESVPAEASSSAERPAAAAPSPHVNVDLPSLAETPGWRPRRDP